MTLVAKHLQIALSTVSMAMQKSERLCGKKVLKSKSVEYGDMKGVLPPMVQNHLRQHSE